MQQVIKPELMRRNHFLLIIKSLLIFLHSPHFPCSLFRSMQCAARPSTRSQDDLAPEALSVCVCAAHAVLCVRGMCAECVSPCWEVKNTEEHRRKKNLAYTVV